MVWNPYSVALFISGLVSICLAGYGWKRRTVKGAMAYCVLMLASAIYSTGYALELASFSIEQMLVCIRIEYLGIVFLSPLWLVLMFRLIGENFWLSKWTKSALFLLPVVTVVMVYTNDLHHLFYADVSLNTDGPFAVLNAEKGPWYWVHSAYTALCYVISMVLLTGHFFRASAVHRKAIVVIVSAASIVWVGCILTITRTSPFGIDCTPFCTTISGPLLLIALVRFRVFDLIPVARARVVDCMEDGVIVLNAQSRIVSVNPAVCSLLGVMDRQVIGQEMYSIRDLTPGAKEISANTLSGSERVSLHALGQKRLEWRRTTVKDPDGEFAGSVVFLRDVTARMLAEEVLVEREQLYRTLVENMRDVVWKTDPNFIVTYVSPTDAQMRGYGSDEVIGKSVWAYLTDESTRTMAFQFGHPERMLLDGQRREHGTFVLDQVCKDGSIIGTEVTFRPIHGDEGEVVGYQGVTSDITIRKAAEEALKQSHDRLAYLATHDPLTDLANRMLFNSQLKQSIERAKWTESATAVLSIDLDGFKKVNDTFGHAAGDEVLKLVSRRLESIVGPGDTVYRISGDEFAILSEGIAAVEVASLIADKVLRVVSLPMVVNGHSVEISCSIGIALFPVHAQTPDQLIKLADYAMYVAKKSLDHIALVNDNPFPLPLSGLKSVPSQ